MLAFSNDYYGMIFRATQSVELFCAYCLSALDDVIEKKKATLAAWEELKKGLLQQMFV